MLNNLLFTEYGDNCGEILTVAQDKSGVRQNMYLQRFVFSCGPATLWPGCRGWGIPLCLASYQPDNGGGGCAQQPLLTRQSAWRADRPAPGPTDRGQCTGWFSKHHCQWKFNSIVLFLTLAFH